METQVIQVVLSGATLGEIIRQAQTLVSESTTTTAATTRTRKAKAAIIDDTEDEIDLLDDDTTEDVADDTLGFDSAEDEETEIVEPPKKGAAKITEKTINAAAMKHASKHGRPKTKALLKKLFKVESILELKPSDYPAVLKALKV